MVERPKVIRVLVRSGPKVIHVKVPGPKGPADNSYTDDRIAALLDLLSPPSADFARPAMAGSPLLFLLGM